VFAPSSSPLLYLIVEMLLDRVRPIALAPRLSKDNIGKDDATGQTDDHQRHTG
jgi:hypothetical protein